MYSDKVMDHFQNPRNVGKLESYDTHAKIASPSCGDLIEMYLKIDNDVITDVKYQTYGCAAAIASGSMATELLKGKTLEEAKKLTNKEVVDELGGLPKEKIHCSVMVEEVITEALKAYYEQQK